MNINFANLLLQFVAMGAWVFLVAAVYAVVEKFLDKHYPDFLAVEAAGASQAPAPVVDEAAKKA